MGISQLSIFFLFESRMSNLESSKSEITVKHHIFQSHSGFLQNKPRVFMNMVALWVRS